MTCMLLNKCFYRLHAISVRKILLNTFGRTFSTTPSRLNFTENEFSLIENSSDEGQRELDLLRRAAFEPITGGRATLVIHPYIKWGPQKKRDTTPIIQIDEGVSLINTLRDWKVSGKEIVPLTSFCKNQFFGTGKLEELKHKIQLNPYCTAIFINVNQLNPVQHTFLEQYFQKAVYDRYLIVVQIFREHAFTKEAKLQIALAELPYLYSRMAHVHSASLNRIGGAASRISGTTFHTPKDVRKLTLHKYEAKIKNALEKLKLNRGNDRNRRRKAEQPVVAIVGYTNSGKTSLVKILSGNQKLMPQNHLFATLDVTFHLGRLPCNLKVFYIDTIGFISDIPTHLLEPFHITLQDAMDADVIIHIQDSSRPDWIFQRDNVTETLNTLNIEKKILKHMIPVANKIDLLNSENVKSIPSDFISISCVTQQGINELKQKIEEEVVAATGRLHLVIRAKTASEEYLFLRKETAVADEQIDRKDNNYSLLSIIITEQTLEKFKRNFIRR